MPSNILTQEKINLHHALRAVTPTFILYTYKYNAKKLVLDNTVKLMIVSGKLLIFVSLK